mmetsp:Transcript_18281/g.52313  ORF Transcript_18281/g.52313 Transcript_18281/m.52313 type:complete len:201 (+) Transcript_18281:5104-5706(+)
MSRRAGVVRRIPLLAWRREVAGRSLRIARTTTRRGAKFTAVSPGSRIDRVDVGAFVSCLVARRGPWRSRGWRDTAAASSAATGSPTFSITSIVMLAAATDRRVRRHTGRSIRRTRRRVAVIASIGTERPGHCRTWLGSGAIGDDIGWACHGSTCSFTVVFAGITRSRIRLLLGVRAPHWTRRRKLVVSTWLPVGKVNIAP